MTNKSFKGWQRILILIIPFFIVVGIFQYVGGLVVGIDITDLESAEAQRTSWQLLIISLFDLTGTLLLLWFFMKNIDREPFVDMGFSTRNRLKEFVAGILIGLVIMGGLGSILMLLNEVSVVNINLDWSELLATTLLFTSVAIVEETLMRGYILKNLMLSMNKYVALMLSSVLFSLMHGANPNVSGFSLFDLFLAGVVLGLPYLYTRNLWFPIALHLSWNLFQSLFGFNVSGQDTYSIIELQYSENNLTNGGAFGLEGSYLSIIAEILTIILIVVYYQRQSAQNLSKS